MDRFTRLRHVASRAGLELPADPLLLDSESNDTWRLGDAVLRICWRGDRRRLHREALLLDRLPSSVLHPRLMDAGHVDELSWTMSAWIDGDVLTQAWPSMSARDRDAAADQLGAALHELHGWTPDREVHDEFVRRPPPTSIEAILGADVNPLPVGRALSLIEVAKQLPFIDVALLDLLADRLEALRTIDPLVAPGGVIIHGDAHFDNILWNGSEISGLLDFEWARLGPRDLELQPLLRDAEKQSADLFARLVGAYPALVEAPDLVERLWLYDLAFNLRHLIVTGLAAPPSGLPDSHPLSRLTRILGGPEYIERLLGRLP